MNPLHCTDYTFSNNRQSQKVWIQGRVSWFGVYTSSTHGYGLSKASSTPVHSSTPVKPHHQTANQQQIYKNLTPKKNRVTAVNVPIRPSRGEIDGSEPANHGSEKREERVRTEEEEKREEGAADNGSELTYKTEERGNRWQRANDGSEKREERLRTKEEERRGRDGDAVVFPVVFFDGEREINIGNVRIHSSVEYKTFQSILGQKIWMSTNEITIYLVQGKRSKFLLDIDKKILIADLRPFFQNKFDD
ncbi:hypothetical protein LguiB_005467 [Lonicera macranthoides]